MNPNKKLMVDQGEPFFDPERYGRLVGKLIYLTLTRPNLDMEDLLGNSVKHFCCFLFLVIDLLF